MQITINNIKALRLAQISATKDPGRLYMSGVLFSGGSTIMATNGHVGMRCKEAFLSPEPLTEDVQVRIDKAIPKAWKYATLDLDTFVLTGYNKKDAIVGLIQGSEVKHKFPDLQSLIDAPVNPEPVEVIGLNAEYLMMYQKAVEAFDVVIQMQGNHSAMIINSKRNESIEYIVMPVKV